MTRPHRPSDQQTTSRDKTVIRILAFICLVGGFQVATQYFAHQFNYQDPLGAHFHQLYAPWSILLWRTQWYDQHPAIFDLAAGYGILFSSVGLILVLVIKMMFANSSRANKNLYGSARWADRKDIEAAGLLSSGKSKGGEAVYVGAWRDKSGKTHYLKHSGPEHVLCFAPTRSGKGVSLVMPTLLSWTQSAVITDLKGELWALTAGWRKQHASNSVLRFDPASALSCHWNPLDEIIIGSGTEVADVQNLVNLIVDPDGKGLETHWQKTAHALLVGLILHVLYKSERDGTPATLPAVDAMLSDPDRDIRELWMEMVMPENGDTHPVIAAAARDMLDRPEEEAGSVLSTAKSYLALYRDPIVAGNISDSDFYIRDLMHHASPVSLYIVSHPNDKSRLRPLIRILINMIVRKLAGQMVFRNGEPVTHYQHRLLLMLDEFPSLGKLEIFQESLAFIAGYGIKAYLICQDINQLKSRESGYGHDEAITSNCHIQTAFAPNRIETAEHLSKLTGQTTVIKEQITTSGRRSSMMHGHVTRTLQETQRALLTPDECMRLPGATKDASGRITKPGDMIIYVAGYPAIYGVQPLYFQDEVFAARAKVDPPLSSDRLTAFSEWDGLK
ncbi:type IV secretion system protein VirD4 [Nitrosomonas aestuarii]|uniref:Type IV secretion system protein VirD4 n=1 Tax=Nitrosomonas aestuarii TaxID=52441 RepID=A0A1I4DAD5_9PROT|nr:type IV secretory system conjugative DNA transfer family protein [Nitrosomonas aestuarii]SFK88891.1 type IV secretion system protein VirD4 [Nitrosomonas aestuarii]